MDEPANVGGGEPSEVRYRRVHPNALSQCPNLVLVRVNGADDVADLERMFSHVRPMLLRESLTFGLGQALGARAEPSRRGVGAPCPRSS
jgi:hypothetical protein